MKSQGDLRALGAREARLWADHPRAFIFQSLRGSCETLQGQAGQDSPEAISVLDRAGQNGYTYESAAGSWTTEGQAGKQLTSAPHRETGAAGVPRNSQDKVGTLSWAPPQGVTSKP